MGSVRYKYSDRYKSYINLLATWIWEKITVKGDIPPYGRYGHSADRYLNSIVIFGGEKNYNTILKIRECVSDVRIFIPGNYFFLYLLKNLVRH